MPILIFDFGTILINQTSVIQVPGFAPIEAWFPGYTPGEDSGITVDGLLWHPFIAYSSGLPAASSRRRSIIYMYGI